MAPATMPRVKPPTAVPESLESLLREAVALGASDLHVAVGSPPMARIHSVLTPLADYECLGHETVERLLMPTLRQAEAETLERERELDYSLSVPGAARFRGNLLWQRGSLGGVFRTVPSSPIPLSKLGMPESVIDLARRPKGLVLVTGATGSGKTTTLAAMVHELNQTEALHIVTIEDPIEFLHRNQRSVIRQRELGSDTLSFAAALKHVLRQDPDVILVGELRDLDTISLAVTAAETGHLVLGTLHTNSAASTIDRIVDVYPAHQQPQIRTQLAATLAGVVAQTLVPKADGSGRVCAVEVLLANQAVRNVIREAKTHQIPNLMLAGQADGMTTLNRSLASLVRANVVTPEAALAASNEPGELATMLGVRPNLKRARARAGNLRIDRRPALESAGAVPVIPTRRL